MKFGPAPERPAAPTVHTLPLLDALLRDSLDPAYGEATARRKRAEAAGAKPPSRSSAHWVAVIGVALVSVVAGLAIGQQRASAPDAAKTRANLIREINSRTDLVAFLTKSADALRADTATRRDALLNDTRAGADLTELVRQLDAATGSTVLKGGGLKVTMSDATADNKGTAGTGEEGKIQDRDVQDVVNALWAAGAKGIAINGIRLTAQTAIRTAGEAILVDFRPQSSPYEISAVSTVDGFANAFSSSDTAQRFDAWSQLYGLGFSLDRSKNLTLPAAAPSAPRHATALTPLPSKSASGAPSSSRSSSSSPSASSTTP